MVNFSKLKNLINSYERVGAEKQKDFFEKLYNIAKIELNIRQTGLGEWFK